MAIAQRTLQALEEKMNRDRLSDGAKTDRERKASVANNLAESQARIASLSAGALAHINILAVEAILYAFKLWGHHWRPRHMLYIYR